MPNGRTHDRITWACLPIVGGATLLLSRSLTLTLIVSGSFLFSGLMFGPDLDIYSCQFKRWGVLRYLWLPYQKALRHRSFWSHGPIVGTTLRVAYLSLWLAALSWLVLHLGPYFVPLSLTYQQLVTRVSTSLQTHPLGWLSLYFGLELGAMSHSLSDWCGSAYKRYRRSTSRSAKIKGKPKSQP